MGQAISSAADKAGKTAAAAAAKAKEAARKTGAKKGEDKNLMGRRSTLFETVQGNNGDTESTKSGLKPSGGYGSCQ